MRYSPQASWPWPQPSGGLYKMEGPRLRLEKVSFEYDSGRPVLHELSMELNAGDRIGITGSNGSGKTTLVRLIMGLVKPTSGVIEIFGEERRSEQDFQEIRGKVGMLFQDSDDQLFSPTVFDDVAFGPLNLGRSEADVKHIVARTLKGLGLDGYEDRITYKLSHGEKRLVALATILAMEPEILLLDEPTAGLDEKHEKQLTEILLGLHHEMIIVSHSKTFLANTSTRSLTMWNGTAKNAE